VYLAQPDVFDGGQIKPVRIWSLRRRPILAGGTSNGDIPMLHDAGREGLRLLLLHDGPDREFDYVAGAEKSLERAARTAGPWSASRTTGPRSSPTPKGGDVPRTAYSRAIMAAAARSRST
jgi:hypothetical protein